MYAIRSYYELPTLKVGCELLCEYMLKKADVEEVESKFFCSENDIITTTAELNQWFNEH